MKKIALLLVIFAFSSIPVFPQTIEILRRMDTHQKALKSLQANLTINKFSVQLGGTYSKESAVKFVSLKNDYLIRLDSIKPAPENFIIVKNQFLLYLPDLQTAYTGNAADSQTDLFFPLLNLSKEKLKKDYTIRYIGEAKVSATIATWHLELTPKTAKTYKSIELWVDRDGMQRQSKIIETGGDWTSILLGNLQKNITINTADFKINLPKETKIVKK